MGIPRIIVVDDQYGGTRSDGRNRLRENFCLLAGIRDITGDVQSEEQEEPVAEAVFCRGQVVEDGVVRNDIDDVLKTVRRGWDEWPRWAVLLLDLQFNTGMAKSDGSGGGTLDDQTNKFGWRVLAELRKQPDFEHLPIIMLSSTDMTGEDAQREISSGAQGWADKDHFSSERLQDLLDQWGLLEDDALIGRSPKLLAVLQITRRSSRNDSTLLITGPTGGGKGVLARFAHRFSSRSERPFVTVVCSAIAPALIESELFGSIKGAFTGAVSRKGILESAVGGTVFLDEIGELTLETQKKLLHFLQFKEITQVGGTTMRHLDVRIICATNCELKEMVGRGTFREDLYYRLTHEYHVNVPSLKERKEDIPLLANHVLDQLGRRMGRKKILGQDAETLLLEHDWPGNMRDLEGVLRRAIEATDGAYVSARNLAELHTEALALAQPTDDLQLSQRPVPVGLKELVCLLEATDFDAGNPKDLMGLAPKLQEAFARAYAKLLRAALVATSLPTIEHPEGKIKIHPAMKYVTGDSKLTATKAADAIKRILSVDKSLQDELLRDPILAEAYEIAVKLRPKSGRSKAKNSNSHHGEHSADRA